jgi:hypothetical protein
MEDDDSAIPNENEEEKVQIFSDVETEESEEDEYDLKFP